MLYLLNMFSWIPNMRPRFTIMSSSDSIQKETYLEILLCIASSVLIIKVFTEMQCKRKLVIIEITSRNVWLVSEHIIKQLHEL